MKTHLCCLLLVVVTLATAHAQQHPINISSVANKNWCVSGQINCSTLPFGTKTYNGVTFHIPGDASANNAWFAYWAVNGGGGKASVTIPVKIANVKTVYTLMNTDWGSTEKGLLSITFTGSKGATWTYNPIGNVNIRDYNHGVYTNSIDCGLPAGVGKSTTVTAFNNGKGQRLDMQIYELPASFEGQTLLKITIDDLGATNVQRSFIAAVTVSTAAP